MPHFRTTIDPPGITVTSAALGENVWPSLKMARAALFEAVAVAIDQANADRTNGVAALNHAHAERVRDLRAARAEALHIREADLPQDEPTTGHKIVTGLQEAIAHAKGETGPSEPAPAEAA